MPSISVDPIVETSSGPTIGGTVFPRPSTMTENTEIVRATVSLANGGERVYNKGTRLVFELSWAKVPKDVVDQLRTVASSPFVTYVDMDGNTHTVSTSPVTADAIAGTYPVRYSTSITLRERDLT